MPSKTASTADSSRRANGSSNFVDDYLADWDNNDPLRSPSPGPASADKEGEKKKDVLGIEQELDLKRKPRVPRVKLDENRLLSDKGIPKLRKMAPRIKFKGKGHEFDDAARLLSYYQAWLDDLFPKATFLDALAMVEKTGHKTTIRNARLQWIDEGKPKPAGADDDLFDEDNRIHRGSSGPQQAERVAPVFEKAASAAQGRAQTPAAEDLFGDDIYNATPLRNTGSAAPGRQAAGDDVPDEDDLDALMAEAEAEAGGRTSSGLKPAQTAPSRSIFGNGGGAPDDDDLEALMAEAEAQSAPAQPSRPVANGSIFGDGTKQAPAQGVEGDGDDLDALMAEAEAEAQSSAKSRAEKGVAGDSGQQAVQTAGPDDGDDLDALMAEADAAARPSNEVKKAPSAGADAGQTANFDDDEEAMAEMEGLW